MDGLGDETGRRPTDDVVWRPSDEYVRTSRLRRFMDRHGIADLDALLQHSTDDLDWFWRAVSDDLDLEWYRPFEQVVDTSRSEEHTSELQSRRDLVCRLLLEKKK